jgi:hypothetical protein
MLVGTVITDKSEIYCKCTYQWGCQILRLELLAPTSSTEQIAHFPLLCLSNTFMHSYRLTSKYYGNFIVLFLHIKSIMRQQNTMSEEDKMITYKHSETALFWPPLIPFKAAQLTQVTNLLKPLDKWQLKCALSLVQTYSSDCRERWFDLESR